VIFKGSATSIVNRYANKSELFFPNDTVDWFMYNDKERPEELERLGWDGWSIDYTINSYGFRDDFDPKKATAIALGDSHTFGIGVKKEQRWSNLLDCSVVNLGIPGASKDHMYRVLKVWIETVRPKFVFMLDYEDEFRRELCLEHHDHKAPAKDLLYDMFQGRLDQLESEYLFERVGHHLYYWYGERDTFHLDNLNFYWNEINTYWNDIKSIDAIENICRNYKSRLVRLIDKQENAYDGEARDLIHGGVNFHMNIASKFNEHL